MSGEFELIRWIRNRAVAASSPLVRLGIGDDCSILESAPDGRGWLVTSDMLLDGRHFRLAEGVHAPELVGRKAMAVNVSDIAAMAGEPVAAYVSVALPRAESEAIAHGLTLGLNREASRFGVTLAGGDTNVWNGPLVISVTLLGLEPPGGAVLRSGARPGDVIAVTGPLGGSLPSGRDMRPEPRVAEAAMLKRLLGLDLHAMIDLSDGLGGDLRHILEESGDLGAELRAADIPVHADVFAHYGAEIAAEPLAALRHALSDGEDFELCLCVAPDAAAKLPASVRPVGVVTDSGRMVVVQADGEAIIWTSGGFDHFRNPGEMTQ